ncbi:MAG: PD-(D/E)XK nuclease family transposase, partial [Byssovorax sp.]
ALCDVVGVTICNFSLWSDRNEHGRFKVPMLSRWRMQEQHSGEKGMPQVQYAFLELPKYDAGDDPETLVDRWAYFFREAKNLNVVPPALSEGPFRDALEVARTATFEPEEWEAYERAKMAEQDARGALAVAHQEGHKSGLEEGHKSGLAEGTAKAILAVLGARGLVVDEVIRARILGASDVAVLARWLSQAVNAASAEEAVATPGEPRES